jgi:xylulokinase
MHVTTDLLLAKLARNHDLARVKSIGGAAQVGLGRNFDTFNPLTRPKHALVWWKSTTVPSLSSLDPTLLLHDHFSAHTFSLPNTPVFQDTASHAHALVIEDLLLGPERMAARVGTAATPSMVSAQLLRVRETWQQEVWARTGRVQLASAFLCSLLSGKWISMGEAEACATGMWVHANTPASQGHWDEGVLDIVGGSREEGRRVRGWLGDVDTSGGGKRAGNVSRYLVERYRFDPGIYNPFSRNFPHDSKMDLYRNNCGSIHI